MGRLAVVPMMLEARSPDVTPGMIAMPRTANLAQTVDALETIYAEEVKHVACQSNRLVRCYFKSMSKSPFNKEKRAAAGLPPDSYYPLVDV